MSLLLALQTPQDVTGSGASSISFTDSGAGLETFLGSGSSNLAFADSGAAVEIFIGSGGASVGLTDAGDGAVVEGEAPAYGGGWTYRERDKTFRKTVKAFERALNPQPPQPKRRAKPGEVFAYASESTLAFASSGNGVVGELRRGAGSSRVSLTCQGRGRIEESAADIIRLLLMIDEV